FARGRHAGPGRHGRGAGIRQHHVRRASLDGYSARRSAKRSARGSRASERKSMSTALMWLLDGIAKIPATEARVSDLTLDSRQARPGSLFFALPGLHAHGLEFAADAAQRGAGVVLWEPRGEAMLPALPPDVFTAAVPNLKNLVGRIADR